MKKVHRFCYQNCLREKSHKYLPLISMAFLLINLTFEYELKLVHSFYPRPIMFIPCFVILKANHDHYFIVQSNQLNILYFFTCVFFIMVCISSLNHPIVCQYYSRQDLVEDLVQYALLLNVTESEGFLLQYWKQDLPTCMKFGVEINWKYTAFLVSLFKLTLIITYMYQLVHVYEIGNYSIFNRFRFIYTRYRGI